MKDISVVWTTDLEVGITEIDMQHRHLFALLADFYTQLQKGAGRDISAALLEKLMSYAGEHFSQEEARLQGHPELPEHHQKHYAFIKQMHQFERDYLSGDISVAINMVAFVADWLRQHIAGTDRQQFLQLKTIG